ncbi:MAG TPA: MBOAT family protein [Syntrophobacteraceae bacterium]|nr:MBOAT family protein [Syntrophobacteraceae bacterium]
MGLISLDFALFLLVVLLLNWVLVPTKTIYRLFLLGACYVFYGSLSPVFLLLLIHFSFWTWLLGLGIGGARSHRWRKGLLSVHLVIGVGGLVFFKYYDLLYESLSHVFAQMGIGTLVPELDLAVPVGISFFTFQGLSYTIDVFRDPRCLVKKPLDIFIFTAFFPTILSGPIMRSKDFIPQIGNMRLDGKSSGEAFSLIVMGLAKKLVLSSYLLEHVVQPVFESPGDYSSVTAAVGALGYSVQILCDFSGYTDLVTGIALLMGYSIPPNFNNPYSARNLKDFWHRWHISLSLWLRDYLYIPLGGNRGGPTRKYLNIFITMTLGGLWHGANWNFLIWGCFHGLGLVATHLFTDVRTRITSKRAAEATSVPANPLSRPVRTILDVASWASTFGFVTVGWVFFGTRSLDQATALLRQIFAFDLGGRDLSPSITAIVVAVIAVVLLHEALRIQLRAGLNRLLQATPIALQIAVLSLLMGIILRLAPDGVPQFIYYQF